MGYWTYHQTYKDSCCCTPCCLMFALTFPVWPLICGAAIVKEKIPAFYTKVTVHTDAAEQNEKMDISVEPNHGGDK